MRKIIFELCAETMGACLAARKGGADRIELCSALSEGGLTPSHGFVHEAVARSGLPVHVLVRPRGGSYLYSAAEVAVMREDIVQMKSLGAAGVVLGLLKADGGVDVDATRALVELARPMEVTFHRAFDSARVLVDALEQVMATGCDRVLTSGGRSGAMRGVEVLAALVAQAGDRIHVAVGGGLRLQNAAALAQATKATHFHGSLLPKRSSKAAAVSTGTAEGYTAVRGAPTPSAVRQMVRRLREG